MIKRLARIAGAYVVASQASGFALLLSLILLGVLVTALGARPPALGTSDRGSSLPSMLALMMLLAVGSGAGFFIMVVAFVPALIVIAVAEAARLRSVKFYVGAGAIGAIVCWALLVGLLEPFAMSLAPERETVMFVLIAALVGVIAGLVYWRIAGRSAGDWRGRPASAQNPSLVSGHVSADAPAAGSHAPTSPQT